MGLQPLYNEVSHTLLWASSRAARVKMTESVTPNFRIYCVNFIVCITEFTSAVAGRIIQSGRPLVGDPRHTRY